MEVRKTAKIRKQYNQVPHLTQDTTWESNKNTINITNRSQEVSPLCERVDKSTHSNMQGMRGSGKFCQRGPNLTVFLDVEAR